MGFYTIPLWKRVERELDELRIPFSKRRSASSSYYECSVDGRILLVRVSDHPEIQGTMTWPPDYNVVDAKGYNRMKKDLKRLKHSENFKKMVKPVSPNT